MAFHWKEAPRPLAPVQPHAVGLGLPQAPGASCSYAVTSFSQATGAAAMLPPQQPATAALRDAGGGTGEGDGRLRSIDELPACFRPLFRFRYFNAIQNDCWPVVFGGQSNVVIAAPTGGGGREVLAHAPPNCQPPAMHDSSQTLPDVLVQVRLCFWSWQYFACCRGTWVLAGSMPTTLAT